MLDMMLNKSYAIKQNLIRIDPVPYFRQTLTQAEIDKKASEISAAIEKRLVYDITSLVVSKGKKAVKEDAVRGIFKKRYDTYADEIFFLLKAENQLNGLDCNDLKVWQQVAAIEKEKSDHVIINMKEKGWRL